MDQTIKKYEKNQRKKYEQNQRKKFILTKSKKEIHSVLKLIPMRAVLLFGIMLIPPSWILPTWSVNKENFSFSDRLSPEEVTAQRNASF